MATPFLVDYISINIWTLIEFEIVTDAPESVDAKTALIYQIRVCGRQKNRKTSKKVRAKNAKAKAFVTFRIYILLEKKN